MAHKPLKITGVKSISDELKEVAAILEATATSPKSEEDILRIAVYMLSAARQVEKLEASSPLVQQLVEGGGTPLFLVGGKEIGDGYRNYMLALPDGMEKEYVVYVLQRLLKIISGDAKLEVEGN